MPEIIITYYNEDFSKDNALKIKNFIRKIRGIKPDMNVFAFNPIKGYGEIKYFSSGPMILERSELIKKIEKACEAEKINKEEFKIDIKGSL